MRVNNYRVGTRLAASFGVMVVLLLLVAAAGLGSMLFIKKDMQVVTEVNNEKLALNYELAEQVHAVNRIIRNMVIFKEPDDRKREASQMAGARSTYQKSWDKLKEFAPDDKEQGLRDAIDRAARKSRLVNFQVIVAANEGRDEDARELLLKTAISSNVAWLNSIMASAAYQEEQNDALLAQSHQSFTMGLVVIGGVTLLASCLAVWGGWFITGSVTRPVRYATACALRLAEGDLRERIERRSGPPGRDETSQLIAAMQKMHNSLCLMVVGVKQNACGVTVAAQEIATGSVDLARRTEVQAASLQQTASTMDTLTTSVRTNSDTTLQAQDVAEAARRVAGKGGVLMQQVVASMAGIDNSSRRIADINGVIDGIAFQTNILALNAAVEAARAGEQGRGFAVVASEVRSLAQRSATAAREIKSLIQKSVEQVGAGTQVVQTAGKTMGEIESSIGRVTQLMAEVTAVTQEQAAGIAQVGQSVTEIDSATQQNAALVEQSSAAAESLNQQALLLMDTVAKFMLPDAAVLASMEASRQADTATMASP